MFRLANARSGLTALIAAGALFLFTLAPGAANAHEFVVALRAAGAEREPVLVDALRGFLLATTEQDAHANEESNGHLGGLDVYIVPQPQSRAAGLPELKTAPGGPPDIVVVIGASRDLTAGIAVIGDGSVLLRQGMLHDHNRWDEGDAQDPDSFASRYFTKYGQPATQWAARGYNAARRIDAAVRPLGGVNNTAALERALRAE